MFIQTEETPNPSTLKFIPGAPVLSKGSLQLQRSGNYAQSPLAERLFRIEGVEALFLAQDFLSVTKTEAASWTVLKPHILAALMEHFTLGQPVLLESLAETAHQESSDDSEIIAQIKELLDTRIRPAVAQDGGDITFESFEDGVLYVTMKGACAGCPSSTATLKAGIENMMKYYVPEVLEVRQAQEFN